MKTKLKFNPDTMTVADLKRAADTLRQLFVEYDLIEASGDEAEKMVEVGLRVAQIRDGYELEYFDEKSTDALDLRLENNRS